MERWPSTNPRCLTYFDDWERDGHPEKVRDENDNRAIQVKRAARGAALAKRCYETACMHERRLTMGLKGEGGPRIEGALDLLYQNVTDTSLGGKKTP